MENVKTKNALAVHVPLVPIAAIIPVSSGIIKGPNNIASVARISETLKPRRNWKSVFFLISCLPRCPTEMQISDDPRIDNVEATTTVIVRPISAGKERSVG